MAERTPLPTLLSQTLVAFTIEFDNEAEHRVQHWTTRGSSAGARRGVWLASQAMWANFMQFIPEEGVALGKVDGCARLTNLAGLKRWRYVEVKPDPADERSDPPESDWLVRPTPAGLRAQEIWRPLSGEIEGRWRERFTKTRVDRLALALRGFASRAEISLPQYLPVVAIAMGTDPDKLEAGAAEQAGAVDDLSALLSKVLMMFTLDFERETRLSLPISANTLRVLGEEPLRLRDLPRLTGVSKEAVSMSLGLLKRTGCAVIEPDPSATRGQVSRLTPKGQKAQDNYRRVLAETEARWAERFGDAGLERLRNALEGIVGAPGGPSPLLKAIEPYPEGWWASGKRPEILPHYPMVLHRGGWPDGA
jgi:DNA-binding MarR family transcriptional regulator